MLRLAVSNTGPLISAFQSDCVGILRQLYDHLYIASSEIAEFTDVRAAAILQTLLADQFVVAWDLTEAEKEQAQLVATAIAKFPTTHHKDPRHHYAEAEAITLFLRPSLLAQEVLLDEQAARVIAQQLGIPVLGFAGCLVRAHQHHLLSAQAVQIALKACQQQGTHYSQHFIDSIYRKLLAEEE